MTTSSPVPPLVEHTGGNSYHLRRKSILRKSKSARERDGKENEAGEEERRRERKREGDATTSARRKLSASNGRQMNGERRNIKSAGAAGRRVYKTHKAEIQFPIPHAPTTSSSGSPRKGRLANGRTRKSRSAAASLFVTDSRGAYGDAHDGTRPPSWPEESGTNLNETIYGLPAYGTPTLALRERTNLLEKEKLELFYRLQAYEEELAARNEENRQLKEKVTALEEENQKLRSEEESKQASAQANALLTQEVDRSRAELEMMQQEYQKLEFAFEDSEAHRSEYEKRCYFLLLDTDSDGLIQLPELATHEILLPYAPELLEICFTNWNYQSGIRNLMSWDDFSMFFQYIEDKTTRAAQSYWFNVLDIDGDGYIGIHDMKWLYDHVDKSEHQGCIEFEDLLCQLLDMVRPKDPSRGFSLSELRKSKLSAGIIGILTNHNHMLLRRSTSEWATGNRSPDLPL